MYDGEAMPYPMWRAKARVKRVSGACRNVPQHARSVLERAGPVKLQTKALLCSDRHSSPGMPRMAKDQTSAGKHAGGGRYPFRVMAGQCRRRTTKGQEVFSPIRVSIL